MQRTMKTWWPAAAIAGLAALFASASVWLVRDREPVLLRHDHVSQIVRATALRNVRAARIAARPLTTPLPATADRARLEVAWKQILDEGWAGSDAAGQTIPAFDELFPPDQSESEPVASTDTEQPEPTDDAEDDFEEPIDADDELAALDPSPSELAIVDRLDSLEKQVLANREETVRLRLALMIQSQRLGLTQLRALQVTISRANARRR